MERKKTKRLRIETGVYEELKGYAAERGLTVADYVSRIVKDFIANPETSQISKQNE